MIRRLRSEGMSRRDAQEAAWDALEDKFPPLESPVDLVDTEEPDATVSWKEFAGVPDSTPELYYRDAGWVYDRLAVEGLKPEDAPSPGAWSLLQWAKRNLDRFFEQVMPKAVSAQAKAAAAGDPCERDDSDDLTVLDRLIDQATRQLNESAMENLPQHVVNSVQSATDELNRKHSICLSAEFRNDLTARMTTLIDQVVKAALEDPSAYQGIAVD